MTPRFVLLAAALGVCLCVLANIVGHWLGWKAI